MLTTAVPYEDGWLLNGTKAWVTNGYEAKTVIVFATTNKKRKTSGVSAFLVPIPSEGNAKPRWKMEYKLEYITHFIAGLSLGKKEEKLGIRASSTCSIYLENVKVGKENLLGKENVGFKIAMSALSKS